MNKQEFGRARDWRIRNEMSPQQLADAIGYSPEVVYSHERLSGFDIEGAGRPRHRAVKLPKEWAWLRYKRACGDLDAELNGRKKGRTFSW